MKPRPWTLVPAAGLALLLGSGSAGAAPIRLMTSCAGRGEPAASLATCVEAAIGREIERRFSCVELSRASAIASRSGGPARRKPLGGDRPDRGALARAGIGYIVSTHVAVGIDSARVATTLVRTSGGRTLAAWIATVGVGAAREGDCAEYAKAFADRMAGVPAFAPDCCPSPIEWIGTVTIEGSETGSRAIASDGVNFGCTTSKDLSCTRRVVIQILATGASARDSESGVARWTSVCQGEDRCGSGAGVAGVRWTSTGQGTQRYAADATVAARVVASLERDTLRLDLHVDPVPRQTTTTRKIVYENGGGRNCTTPAPVDEKDKQAVEEGEPFDLAFEAPAGADSTHQSGVWNAPYGPLAGLKRTAVSWSLTRVRPTR